MSAPTVGDLTAADLLYGDPPEPLIPPFLTPEGATVLYGPGGVGKGLVACWLIKKLVEASHVVLVIDYEGQEREWGSRLRWLGMTNNELRQVHYLAPYGPDWTERTGPLSQVVDLIERKATDVDATFVVADSYSMATSNGDSMGGEAGAKEYFGALQRIALPSLTIAHVTGTAERFPAKPFGSVAVHNRARETWAVEKVVERSDPSEAESLDFEHVVSLELRNMKQNSRQRCAPQFIDFAFRGDHTIEVSRSGGPKALSLADQCAAILTQMPKLNLRQLAAAIKEETGRKVSEETLRVTLRRDTARFPEDRTTLPHLWSCM